MQVIEAAAAHAVSQAREKGVEVPSEAYGYFLGQMDDGCRYIFGARLRR
jgi:hypothetical protein